jgi:hypothetical protein
MKKILFFKKHFWNNQEFEKLSSSKIKTMISANSKSLVKKIFIISVVEFSFWIIINLLYGNSSDIGLTNSKIIGMLPLLDILNYLVLIFFIFKFYIYYRDIKTMDNIKEHMFKILRVKSLMKKYVIYNVCIFLIGSFTLYFNELFYNEDLVNNLSNQSILIKSILIIGVISITLLIALLIMVIYRFIYGYYIKKLMINYKELKEMSK